MFLLKRAIPDPQKLLFEIPKGPILVENQISSWSRPSPIGRLLAGGQDPIFFASSDFGLFDPKKEENNLQIGAQGGATGRRHPMRPFLAPIQ